MRRAKRVVFALGALGEAGETPALAQRADAVAAAGEDLVWIGLMTNVPDQAVARCVENVVERNREFDHAEPGAEMAAGDRDGRNGLMAQLVGELPQLILGQATQIVRCMNLIEQQRIRGRRHEPSSDFVVHGTTKDNSGKDCRFNAISGLNKAYTDGVPGANQPVGAMSPSGI